MVAAADVADLRLDWRGHVCWRLRGRSGRVGRRRLDHVRVRIRVVGGRKRRAQEHPADKGGAEAFWTKVYQHGRPIYQSTGTSNVTEAKRILDVRRGAAQRGESVLPQVDRVRWEEAQADLIAYYEATGKRDVAEAKSRVAHLGLYFAGWRIARIDTPAIHGYVVHRKQQKAAAATINRELATLSKALRVAHQNKKLAGHPSRIEKLQENNIRQGFFEREQFEAVRKHLPAYARPVVTFMYITGWRIRSEALPLQWRQVDFQAGTVRLEPGTTKNKDGRTFYLTPELRTCLEAQRAATEALQRQTGCIIPWVFHREGTPMKSFWKAWKTACRRSSWADPARLPPDGRQEPGARRGTALSRHEDGRPQDRGDLPPIRHRERCGPSGGGEEARGREREW